ncbi:hypothetical protein OG216_06545 [Streptomycetaceae bacterium NBC_01309]
MSGADPAGSGIRPDPRLISTPEDFARALNLLRHQAGLSYRALKERLEERSSPIPQSTLAGWFQGRHLPTPELVKQVPVLLDVCGETDPVEVAAWLAALESVRRAPGPRPADGSGPFVGLAGYQPEDARFFHGRGALTATLAALAEEWRGRGIVAVVGASGTGKSSLLRAGLIPALGHAFGGVVGEVPSQYRLFTPGSDPLRELARVFAAPAPNAGDTADAGDAGNAADAGDTEQRLLEDPRHCAEMAARSFGPHRDGERIPAQPLVVVDQFEELFTLCGDPAQRRAFVEALHAVATSHAHGDPPSVVLGLRADFYPHALAMPHLPDAFQAAQLVVGPLSPEDLRQVLTEPARVARLSVEDGLVELLIREMAPSSPGASPDEAHDPGALPLLSHALLATLAAAKGRTLTVRHYRAAGGLHDAVERTAETAYDALVTREQQDIARQIFLRLVHVEEGLKDSRRRLRLDELPGGAQGSGADTVRRVLDRFVAARLVSAGAETVEIAHESLLTAWSRLRQWIGADRVWLNVHSGLGAALRRWQASGCDDSLLYRGPMLELTREWVDDRGYGRELNAAEQEFLDRSLALRHEEAWAERRRVRRRYQITAVLTILAMLVGGVALYAHELRTAASRDKARTASRALADKADRLRDQDPALAAQFALAAYRIWPTAEARSALLDTTAEPLGARVKPSSGLSKIVAVNGPAGLTAAGSDAGPLELFTVDAEGRTASTGPAFGELPGPIVALAFDPTGRVLAAAGADDRVAVWDVADPRAPRLMTTVTVAGQRIFSVAVSPDRSRLAVGSGDAKVRLWDLADPERQPEPLELVGPTLAVKSVAFHPDGRTLAAGSDDTAVHLWDLADPARPVPLAPLRGPKSRVFAIAISPDGRTLAAGTGAEHSVFRWDITDPARAKHLEPPLTGPASWVNTVAFSPDSRTLAAGSSDTRIRLYDVATGEVVGRLPHPRPVVSAGYRDDGTLVTAATDGIVRTWQVPGPVVSVGKDSVFAVTFDATGRRLGVGPGAGENTLSVWDTTDPRRPVPAGPRLVNPPEDTPFSGSGALSPDGRTMVAGATDGSVQIWDVRDPARPVRAALLRSASEALVESVTISADGRLVAVSGDDSAVHLIDIGDPYKPVRQATLPAPAKGFIYQSSISRDGRLLASASSNHSVYLWDISVRGAPRLVARIDAFADAAYSTAFNRDGTVLAAGSADDAVRLWDVSRPDSPQDIGTPLTGPLGFVYGLAFAPDRDVLVAGATDSTLWMWDLSRPRDPELLATLHGPEGGILALAQSPDGHTLATGGHDRMVRLWETDPERAAAWVCGRAGAPVDATEWGRYVPERRFRPPCPQGPDADGERPGQEGYGGVRGFPAAPYGIARPSRVTLAPRPRGREPSAPSEADVWSGGDSPPRPPDALRRLRAPLSRHRPAASPTLRSPFRPDGRSHRGPHPAARPRPPPARLPDRGRPGADDPPRVRLLHPRRLRAHGRGARPERIPGRRLRLRRAHGPLGPGPAARLVPVGRRPDHPGRLRAGGGVAAVQGGRRRQRAEHRQSRYAVRTRAAARTPARRPRHLDDQAPPGRPARPVRRRDPALPPAAHRRPLRRGRADGGGRGGPGPRDLRATAVRSPARQPARPAPAAPRRAGLTRCRGGRAGTAPTGRRGSTPRQRRRPGGLFGRGGSFGFGRRGSRNCDRPSTARTAVRPYVIGPNCTEP